MIFEWFKGLNPIVQALLATCFTWFVTALGASLVFFFKSINKKVLNLMLGFAAGVMIAASFWSLLAPAIEMAEQALMDCPDKLDDVFAALVEIATHSPDKENAVLIQDMLKKLIGMNRISETYSKTLYQKYFSHRFVSVHDTKVYNLQGQLDFIKENLRKELALKKIGFVECCNDREGYRKVEAEYARVVNFMDNLLLNEEYLRGAS